MHIIKQPKTLRKISKKKMRMFQRLQYIFFFVFFFILVQNLWQTILTLGQVNLISFHAKTKNGFKSEPKLDGFTEFVANANASLVSFDEKTFREKLRLQSFDAVSNCGHIFGGNRSETLQSMRQQFTSLPADVLSSVLERVVPAFCTSISSKVEQSSFQSGSGMQFVLYWQTTCDSGIYDVQFAGSWATLTMAEVEVGTETKTENRLVGHEPCRCLIWCDTCAIYEKHTTTTKIMAPATLSILEYELLETYLKQAALTSAKKHFAISDSRDYSSRGLPEALTATLQ